MIKLFFIGAISLTAHGTIFSDRPFRAAGEALENLSDFGASIISSAADVAATSAGLSAQFIEKTAADVEALAAAANEFSAASAAAGDAIGSRLAAKADLLAQVLPNPLELFKAMISLPTDDDDKSAVVGLTSDAPTISLQTPMAEKVSNKLNAIAEFRSSLIAFFKSIISIKPPWMTISQFFTTVKETLDAHLTEKAANVNQLISQDLWLEKLWNALDKDILDPSALLEAKTQLHRLLLSFPKMNAELLLNLIRDFCDFVGQNLLATPTTWWLPTDAQTEPALSRYAQLLTKPLDFAAMDIHNKMEILRQVDAMARADLQNKLGIISKDLQAKLDAISRFNLNGPFMEYLSKFNKLQHDKSRRPAWHLSEIDDLSTTSLLAADRRDAGEIQDNDGELENKIEEVSLEALDLFSVSPKVGYVNIPTYGSYAILGSPDGRLVAQIPQKGLVPIHRDGHRVLVYMQNTPQYCDIITAPAGTVELPRFGWTSIIISEDGQLQLHLPDKGTLMVTSTESGALTAWVPGAGRIYISPWVPARTLVYVPGFGVTPFSIETGGHAYVHINGWGSLAAKTNGSGELMVEIPRVGILPIKGVGAPRSSPPAMDFVLVDSLGYFPVVPTVTGHGESYVVSIPGQGDFQVEPVNGRPAVTIPGLGQYYVQTQSILGQPKATKLRLAVNQSDVPWVWSLSDASVYFLQKLDAFRPPAMSPEEFLTLVNLTIQEHRDSYGTLRDMDPVVFIQRLSSRLELATASMLAVESIGDHVAAALNGPFPPFEDILDHISEVISEKMDF